ncbi:unnamed protein product [Musa acuminata subsp. burmannicoides]
MPDFPLATGLHPVDAELLHGVAEVLEEGRLVGGVELHEGLGPRVRRQRGVGGQQPQSTQQVLVVHVVEFARRHHVVECGDGRVLDVVGASLLQRLRELGVQCRVVGVPVGAVEAVDPRGELAAVGEAHGVGAAEGDHLLDGELVLFEEGDELVHGHVGGGEVARDGSCGGGESVLAAEADSVAGPAQHEDEVSGGDGEDVGAGDDAGALQLEGGFSADHGVEGVPGEGDVVVGVALGAVEGVGGDQQGSVTAADEAVVEEEAERAGAGGGGGDLLAGHHVQHDLLHLGARLLVVGGAQLRGRWAGEAKGHEPYHQEMARHLNELLHALLRSSLIRGTQCHCQGDRMMEERKAWGGQKKHGEKGLGRLRRREERGRE